MVGDDRLVMLGRHQAALGHQPVEQLGVVDDLHAAQAELRVLVADRVEAVRAGGDDGADPVLGVRRRERRDVLLGEHLEEVLVARPPRRIAGAGLLRAEHGERAPRPGAAAGPWRAPPCGCDRRRRRRSRPRTGSGRRARPPTERSRRSCATGGRRRRRAGRGASVSPRTGTSRPFAQSSRADFGWPHGLPAFSMLRKAALSSFGNRLSSRTALRRISTIVSTCSISTGQPSTHQPQVVHCQTASSGMALSISGRLSASSARVVRQAAAHPPRPPLPRWPRPSTRAGPRPPPPAPSRPPRSGRAAPPSGASGESVLPVTDAGQNSMQRPHSVQARPSSRWRQVRSLRPFAPKTGSGSPSAGSASRSILRSAPRGSRLRK